MHWKENFGIFKKHFWNFVILLQWKCESWKDTTRICLKFPAYLSVYYINEISDNYYDPLILIIFSS